MGNEPRGKFHGSNSSPNPKDDKNLSLLLTVGALCNNANLQNDNGTWRILGDPTEGELIVAVAKAGFDRAELERQYPRVGEVLYFQSFS